MVPGVVPVVTPVAPVVDVDDPITSGAGLMVEEAAVLVRLAGAASEAEAAAVGISTLGWMTLLRTRATAPHEKARAIVTASTQPAASFFQFGMTQLSQASR